MTQNESEPQGTPLEPVWSDETIRTRYVEAFEQHPDVHHWALLCWLRDAYEQERDQLRREHDSLQATIASLITESEQLQTEYDALVAERDLYKAQAAQLEESGRMTAWRMVNAEEERDQLRSQLNVEAGAKGEYSHRNGETDEPTVPGWYWFDGMGKWRQTPPEIISKRPIFVERDDEGDLMFWYGANDDANHACADGWLHGQWWGPISAPWQRTASEGGGDDA